ncbi:MAG: flippase-like domain-containing protein [Candidatus Woesearchaeota archaeon]
MKKLKIILYFFFGFLLSFIAYKFFGLKEVLLNFKFFTLEKIFFLLTYLIFVFFIEILKAYRWKLIINTNIKKKKKEISFYKLTEFRLASFSISYVLPQFFIGGEIIKILLLKKEKIKFNKAISSIILDKSIQAFTDLIFISIMLLYLLITKKIFLIYKILIVIAIIILIINKILYLKAIRKRKIYFSKIFDLKFINKFEKIKKAVFDIEKTISKFYIKHIDIFYKILIINFIIWLFSIINIIMALKIFNINLSLIIIIMIFLTLNFVYLLPLPMTLGSLEFLQIFVFSFLNIDKSYALLISILFRFSDLIKTLLGFNFLMLKGINYKKILKILKIKNE